MGNEEKTYAEEQTEALGGAESVLDPGIGYPQITGDPSPDALMGTPLDPDGHERVAKEVGRDKPTEDVIDLKPVHMDDPEQSGPLNAEAAPIEGNEKTLAAEGDAEAAKAVQPSGESDKAVRGPGATSRASSGRAKG